MSLAKDLLHQHPSKEKRKHKLARLVQQPNSFFMDVKCPYCYKITIIFSHATYNKIYCIGCGIKLCKPTGGRCRLREGCSFRRKP